MTDSFLVSCWPAQVAYKIYGYPHSRVTIHRDATRRHGGFCGQASDMGTRDDGDETR